MHSDRSWRLHPATGTIDLTTTGRRSGLPRRIETWYVVLRGEVHLTGTPGPRDWLANLRAHPHAVLHVDGQDIPVIAAEVVEPSARRALVPEIWAVQPWYRESAADLEAWVADAPLVRLRPSGSIGA